MNDLKRFFALMLCLALMITCFAGCHKKGEIAVKIGDVEFTSGYYACALVMADSEARSKVDEELAGKEDKPEEVKYWKQQIEKTDYTEWVEKRAIEILTKNAAFKTLCAENEVELDSEIATNAKNEADLMWESSYSALFEPNGVAKETFIDYLIDGYLADEYFSFLYGKGGEKEVSADEISKQLTENYVLVNKLEVSFSGLTDEQKTEKKNQLAGYEASLKDGSKTFEEIYLDYNNQSAEDHNHDHEEGESAPQDAHADVLGAEDTYYESDHYAAAKEMAVGDVKVITLEEDAGLVLLVKKDIAADPYYIEDEAHDNMLRQDIVGDQFDEEIEEYGKKLECEVNTSSTKQFKVKNIEYPEVVY